MYPVLWSPIFQAPTNYSSTLVCLRYLLTKKLASLRPHSRPSKIIARRVRLLLVIPSTSSPCWLWLDVLRRGTSTTEVDTQWCRLVVRPCSAWVRRQWQLIYAPAARPQSRHPTSTRTSDVSSFLALMKHKDNSSLLCLIKINFLSNDSITFKLISLRCWYSNYYAVSYLKLLFKKLKYEEQFRIFKTEE